MNDIEFARKLAINYHDGQKYGDHDYVYHLDQVYNLAVEFELSEEIQIAAYLHDILEDTDATFDQLNKLFGWKVALLVFLVTDEGGKNRKEKKAKTYQKTRTLEEAIQLKLCDRIVNVRESIGKDIFKMYKKEDDAFRSSFIYHIQNKKTWDLYFHYVDLIDGSN